MAEMTVQTLATVYENFFAADFTLSGTVSMPAPSKNDPYQLSSSGNSAGVISTSGSSQAGSSIARSNFGKFIFWGSGTATNTFEALIVGWSYQGLSPQGQWVPILLADLICTLGTTAGAQATGGSPANNPPLTTAKYVSTIAVNNSIVVPNNAIWPALANGIVTFAADLSGFQRIQLVLGTNGTPSTTANGAMSGF